MKMNIYKYINNIVWTIDKTDPYLHSHINFVTVDSSLENASTALKRQAKTSKAWLHI